MATLKLYFVVLSEDQPIQITVHRDLLTLQEAWKQADKLTCVGLVHIGFLRPKIKNVQLLLEHKGQVLVSVAVKWTLPEEYQSSIAVVSEMILPSQILPLYLLVKGLGYDQDEPSAVFQSSAIENGKGKHTIAEAALMVLNGCERPLNKEEIFARIIEQGLYRFGTKKPVSKLALEIDRHTQNTDCFNPAPTPLFSKSVGERYNSLERVSTEQEGWIKELRVINPELGYQAESYGIYSDDSFSTNVGVLPDKLRDQFELYRFSALKHETDITDPIALIKILPSHLTSSDVGSLNLPVRIFNVFKLHSINCLDDLCKLSVNDLLRLPNFGRKSVDDLCTNLLGNVEKLAYQVELINTNSSSDAEKKDDFVTNGSQSTEAYKLELVSTIPLKKHFEKALSEMLDTHRQVIEYRTGYNCVAMTLEAVGKRMGVTRERVRQIQKKYVKNIIEKEFWDDCIALKIGQLLIERANPLYLEMLEIEDPWFEGFMGNYQHLAAIIELFSENEIRIVNINGASVVTRIKADDWEDCVSHFRKSLKDKAKDGSWTRHDLAMTFRAGLSEKGAVELLPFMWDEFNSMLQFDGEGDEAKLLTFGVSAESTVQAVLLQAECPLHYTEVAVRATELFGRTVDERLAQNALVRQGAKLFGRGIYGLEKFNPISPRMCNNICLVVINLMYAGPLMKQWHANEILTALQSKYSALPEELDIYILNIILGNTVKLVYLNRLVWCRSDSNQSSYDRIDMADAFIRILEENGEPLKGKEIKERLAGIRGVSKNLQLQPTERMIQIGPDFWGLVERDIGGTQVENQIKLDKIFDHLQTIQKGIHVSEVGSVVEVSDTSSDFPSAYALLNLAQRDERFYLGRSMFLGLSVWDGDTRRFNISEAVRELISTMTEPMSIGEINARIEDLTGLPVDGSVTGVLINSGGVYNQELKVWGNSNKENNNV